MALKRLQPNDTRQEVSLCEWHLRKIFWDEKLLEKLKTGSLALRSGDIKPRKNPTVSSPAPFNQEIVIFDPVSNEEIARCHQFLEADQKTLAGSGHPDPKQIRIGGFDYHQLGRNSVCAHCVAGISTEYSKEP